MKRRISMAIVAGAIFFGGYVTGRASDPDAGARPNASLWAEGCMYKVSTRSDGGGSYSVLTAAVWNYDSRGRTEALIGDYGVRQAIGDYDCERTY